MTLISAGWSTGTQVTNPQDFNPFTNLYQRDRQHYTVFESLFYTNFNNGEVVPWQAKDYVWNAGFTELTIHLRDKVMWSDGRQLTADDVVFTANMLKASTPTLLMSSVFAEWLDTASAPDKLTVVFKLKKPGPRFLLDNLAQGQTGRFVVVPKHIWEGKDAKTFNNFDQNQGWPVGTGPYQVTKTGDQQILYDRRASWWAVDAGLVQAMPAPERIAYVIVAPGGDAAANLYLTNKLDVGLTLPLGVFETVRVQNPDIVTWRDRGPVFGAADGCTLRLQFNDLKAPWDNADVRWAINHAVDRAQIADLAYEGAYPVATLPFSSYGGVQAYLGSIKDLIDQANIDNPSTAKVAERLTKAGFKKGADGKWKQPDGSNWPLTVFMGDGNPIGPVIAEQLKVAGFDAKFEVIQGTAFTDALSQGNFDLMLWVHCGSIYDPWQTLDHFHSKYARPIGTAVPNIRSTSRYMNPEFDAILDQMESMTPSVGDAKYIGLLRQAMTIYLRDMPELTLVGEFQLPMFNTHYWTGWPNEKDPYIAPYIPWEGFNLAIHKLKPTGAK